MLIQLHWQNRDNLDQTEFVAQWEITASDDPEAMHAWAREIISRRRAEIPTGWVPMICTEESRHFVWACPGSAPVVVDGGTNG